MYFLHIVLLVKVIQAIEVEITGDVVFDIKISDLDIMMRSNVTAAPFQECNYEYPEQKQIEAMMSNMMNQLTKVFVRAHEFMKSNYPRRMHETRFNLVKKTNNSFFEPIYNNMTQEYMAFYNSTITRVDRTGRDPCTHQDEIKRIWLGLLNASYISFRRASFQCMEEYLKYEKDAKPKQKRKLEQFLLRELEKISSNQLVMLCDTFQLCFNELL